MQTAHKSAKTALRWKKFGLLGVVVHCATPNAMSPRPSSPETKPPPSPIRMQVSDVLSLMMPKKLTKWRTEHVYLNDMYEGSATSLFTVKGSSMFTVGVMTKSITAAALSQIYYVINTMRPDNRLEGVGVFYFVVLGMLLSFLLVFNANIAYSRFWEARGHIDSFCNASHCMMRKLLFSSDLRLGTPAVEEAVNDAQRYIRAFLILMMQDVRTTNDLSRVPADARTSKEKEDMEIARRRPLLVLGWLQMVLRGLSRDGHMTERLQLKIDADLEEMSQAYHGCTKIRSQPMPFAFMQLITLVTRIYCFSVPITFISAFSYGITVPTFIMGVVYFGMNDVSDHLADPFGIDSNDIHLEVFLRQIDEDFFNYYTEWTMLPRLPGQGPAAPPAEGRPSATLTRMQSSLRLQAGLRKASWASPMRERCSKYKGT